jgi:hypothetical protein
VNSQANPNLNMQMNPNVMAYYLNNPMLNMQFNPNNQNGLANYYNPLIIQNYFAMHNNQTAQNKNCYSSPYTLNRSNSISNTNCNSNYISNNSKFINPQNPNNNMNNLPFAYKNFRNDFNYNTNQDRNSNKTQFNLNNFKTFNNNHEVNQEKKPMSKEEEEEIKKWVESRKRNFPSTNKEKQMVDVNKKIESSGMMSQLERKLREKIKILSYLDKGGYVRNKNKFQKNSTHRRKKKRNNRKKIEPEDGEIVENVEIEIKNEKLNPEIELKITKPKENIKFRNGFRYKKSLLYENLIKPEKIKELNIILQSFRYFINEGLI